MSAPSDSIDRRACERFTLMPMYTSVQAKRLADDATEELPGHAYDISEAGVRIELDQALEPGESITIDLTLPGATSTIAASADVVWVNDAIDDPGPRRMALRFTNFRSDEDHDRLRRYLGSGVMRRAA